MILILNYLTGYNYVCFKHFTVKTYLLVVACGNVLSFWRTFPKYLWTLDIESTNLLKELIEPCIIYILFNYIFPIICDYMLVLIKQFFDTIWVRFLRCWWEKVFQELLIFDLDSRMFSPNTALWAYGQKIKKIKIGWCKVGRIYQVG